MTVGRQAANQDGGPSLVVIGGGLAGLSAVLEAHRKFPEGKSTWIVTVDLPPVTP
jgi:NADH dehydrogenase FAD-containing subunit